MLAHTRLSYKHTISACCLGYVTQAIVNNYAPLLFLTFASDFNLSLEQITLITTVNFVIQLCVDLLSVKVVDKIGYRPCMVAALALSALGLTGLAVFPAVLPSAYTGILAAVALYAIGGGLLEVLVSPIVEACPTQRKSAVMSMLHSFYCWGHVLVVLISTAFFAAFGTSAWRVLACLWALLPLCTAVYFLCVPLYPVVSEDEERLSLKGLFKQKIFWLLMVMMVCAGASEQAMGQWASAFAESGLKVSKTIGDLAGPCVFAVLMGSARILYGRFSDKMALNKMMIGSAVLCVACYMIAAFSSNAFFALIGCGLCGFSVGIFWPGTFSISAQAMPGGGTAMYALMALAGDLGCSSGPTVVGMAASAAGGMLQAGLGVAILFPILILFCLIVLNKKKAA